MAAELLTDASRATDANSNPFAGAQWFFYDAGTTTPLNVFADADLNTSLGAVVTADAGGKFVPIYFDSAKKYRGVLKSADGATTIYDIDPINTGVMNELGQPGGSNAIGFVQAGSGSINRTVQDKARERLSTADKGAVIDGTTDDTAALIATFDRMAITGRADLLSGTYKVSQPLIIPPGVIEGGDVVLDFSGADPGDFPTGRCVIMQGAVPVQIANLNANLAIGDRSFAFAAAHGLTEDDAYQLSGTVDFAGNGAKAEYRKGEMFRVAQAIDTTNVQSEMVCRDTYPFADVTVWKRSGDRFTQGCASLTVIGPDTINYVIELVSLDRTTIDNLRAVGGKIGALAITDCFGLSGRNVDARQTANGGTNPYGIVVSKCQDVRINGRAYGYFNGFTVGGSATAGGRIGMNRDIHFDGIWGSHPTAGLSGGNFHGNTEYSSMRGVFSNGVTLSGNKNEAHGDFFKSSGFSPVQFAEMHGTDFLVTGTLRTSGPDLPTSTGAVHQSGMGPNLRYGGLTDIRLQMYAPNATRLVVFRPTDLARTDVSLRLALDVKVSHPTTRIVVTGRNSTGNELPLIDFTGLKIFDNAVAINWSIPAATKLQGWSVSKSVAVTGTAVPTATAAVTFSPAFPRAPVYTPALASNVNNGAVRQSVGVSGSSSATTCTVQVTGDGTNLTFNATVSLTGSLNEQ